MIVFKQESLYTYITYLFIFLVTFAGLHGIDLLHKHEELPFIIIVPSYNNAQWCIKNLESVCFQNYKNYHVMYVDDCSNDQTYTLVKDFIEKHNLWHKVTLIRNPTRMGAMANLYYTIHACPDQAIVVTVDGDDWLLDGNVLAYLNRVYSDSNVWLTYGQFIDTNGVKGWCHEIPENVLRENDFRHCSPMSHLRTFYAWLFKQIKKEDLMYKDEFLVMTWDKAMMIPMMEMAGNRYKFIEKILYVYNAHNPINDHKVDGDLQTYLRKFIEKKTKYNRLIASSTSVS